MITFVFVIYSLALYWGKVSNGNVTMKSTQLHYFLSENIGWTKDIRSTCPNVGGTFPSFKLGPCNMWSMTFSLRIASVVIVLV